MRALDGISFDLERGEALGLVGESGCGKTTVARAMLRLLPPNATIPEGAVLLRGRELLSMSPEEMRAVRWREIALVTQSAMNALDPVIASGARSWKRSSCMKTCTTGDAVGGPSACSIGRPQAGMDRRYPHEFSGGMRQRAIIAMALALDPALIIADEPTTALDVIMQEQVFDELNRVRRDKGIALILITHDIAVVSENCDRVGVMYAGELVELASTASIFAEPMHPYTIALCNSFPSLESGIASSFPSPARRRISRPRRPDAVSLPVARSLSRAAAPRLPCCALSPSATPLPAILPSRRRAFRDSGRLGATWERAESARAALLP